MQPPDRSSKQRPLPGRDYGIASQDESLSEGEIFAAALQLADMTDAFFGAAESVASVRQGVAEWGKDLLNLYDEFLDILEEELNRGAETGSTKSDPSKRDALVKLQATIECNRDVIASLFTAMQCALQTDGTTLGVYAAEQI